MGVYTGYPLLQQDSIRLILLLPASSPRLEVHCKLQVVTLSTFGKEDDSSSYTTLSYTWGSPENPSQIFIDGQKFNIGRNLYAALQSLRRKDRPVRLWVDAICIDQQNASERNHQVQQMRAIYAGSLQTIIFLGPDDRSTACRNAWDFLEYRSQWAMNESKDPDPSIPKQRQKTVNFKTGYNDVLNSVLSREWFSRIWILQELVVSNQLSIQCGNRRISWDDFARTLFLYFHNGKDDDATRMRRYSPALISLRNLSPGSDITDLRPGWEIVTNKNPGWKHIIQPVKEMCQTRLLYQKAQRDPNLLIPDWVLNDPLAHFIEDDAEFRYGSLKLSQLLARSRRYKSSDARDKVFALLGICMGVSSPTAQSLIDYNKPIQQIYREVSNMLIDTEGTLDILCQSGQQSFPEDLSFASWAGKWDSALFPSITILSRLGGESIEFTEKRRLVVEKHHTWSQDGKILYCTGGKMGTLVSTGDLHISPSSQRRDENDPNAGFKASMELAGKFNRCALPLLENTPWLDFPDVLDPDLPPLDVDKTFEPTGEGYWKVKITSSSLPPSSPMEDDIISSGWSREYNIFGGLGFIGDVAALQEGRKLGIIRCQSERNKREGAREDKAMYIFAVVPECAKVGDVLGSLTGGKTLFLFYPHPKIESGYAVDGWRKLEETRVREALPKNDKGDAEMVHYRLRGECRVNAFEDTWGLVDDIPLMAFIGYVPHEWSDRIFAIY